MPVSANGFRTGRLSKDELLFIEENATLLTAKQISLKLNREIDPIAKYLMKLGKSPHNKKNLEFGAEYDLKNTPYWAEFQNQFSEGEFERFLAHYKEICSQFNNDITKTENLQIIDLARMEVLCDRCLKQQNYSILQIQEYQNKIDSMKNEENFDRNELEFLQRQVGIFIAARQSLANEYKELFTKKSTLFRDLKSTRDQRYKSVQENSSTFSGLLEKILKNPEFSEKCSLEMEKFKLATDNERSRLSDFHEFGDKYIDRPVLSCDTVTEED